MNSFNAARQMRDHDILLKNKDYNKLIAFIDDENFNWLDFNMKQADKIRLFKEGVKSGCEFIKRFDWDDYKDIRHQQIIN